MSDLMVYCNCLKNATNKIDPKLACNLKFDIDGSVYFENENLQSLYVDLLQKCCTHEVKSIAITLSLPVNLTTLMHFIENELSDQIKDWEILCREFIYTGNSIGIIKLNELEAFKSEIGSLWNYWVDVLNSDQEIEDLIIQFETAIKSAFEMNNPILIIY